MYCRGVAINYTTDIIPVILRREMRCAQQRLRMREVRNMQSPSINFWQKKNIPVDPQPPYSPDLSPCDFFLFPRLKNQLKGRHFGTLDDIQKSANDELKGIRQKLSSTATNKGNNACVAV
jgi:transposase